jgi:hypothetical protein
MNQDQARHFAGLALGCIQRELPSSIQHSLASPDDVRGPRELHPAFYGCYDWHSAVHGHWMLVRLVRRWPGLPEAAAIRAALDANLTAAHLAAEAAYFATRPGYERPYGWAWLLQLAAELRTWNDPDGRRWAAHVQPLADLLVARYRAFFPRQTYPIRTGVHSSTAFGFALALDHARAVGHRELDALIVERSLAYFGGDRDVPAGWEPSGDDFLSPSLIEADLMRRVLPPDEFPVWLHGFLPRGLPPALEQPAIVTDRGDGKLAHLDGLNLSRAWCLRAVAGALPAADPLRPQLLASADAHAAAGLAHVATGDYAGEHWLASFAVYLLGVE